MAESQKYFRCGKRRRCRYRRRHRYRASCRPASSKEKNKTSLMTRKPPSERSSTTSWLRREIGYVVHVHAWCGAAAALLPLLFGGGDGKSLRRMSLTREG